MSETKINKIQIQRNYCKNFNQLLVSFLVTPYPRTTQAPSGLSIFSLLVAHLSVQLCCGPDGTWFEFYLLGVVFLPACVLISYT